MKKYLIPGLLLSALLSPLLASADATTTATSTTNLTTCKQISIEKRDTSIGNARTIYNASMAKALDARKDAEKAAVAITDPEEKLSAVKTAVDTYRSAVIVAQAALTRSRKDALTAFDTDSLTCKEDKIEYRTSTSTEPKTSTLKKADAKVQVDKLIAETKQPEAKGFREVFLETIFSIFGNKPQAQ